MLNLKNYILSLKCTWIRRLFTTDANYIKIFESNYTKINNLITRGTTFVENLTQNKTNKFWNDTLNAWVKMCSLTKPKVQEDLLSTNIWNNKDIKIANRPIFYRHWFAKHVFFIKDLIDENGRLLTLESFVEKYNINTNFLEYLGVRTVIENYIRRVNINIVNEDVILANVQIPFNLKNILKTKKRL